mmetsp:Transcript_2839/g.11464  ORF Transcript_2839/g.11464 Transcript_2839/m.11464 type:complete len:353 (-) Transcript_2839:487-1545(-)
MSMRRRGRPSDSPSSLRRPPPTPTRTRSTAQPARLGPVWRPRRPVRGLVGRRALTRSMAPMAATPTTSLPPRGAGAARARSSPCLGQALPAWSQRSRSIPGRGWAPPRRSLLECKAAGNAPARAMRAAFGVGAAHGVLGQGARAAAAAAVLLVTAVLEVVRGTPSRAMEAASLATTRTRTRTISTTMASQWACATRTTRLLWLPQQPGRSAPARAAASCRAPPCRCLGRWPTRRPLPPSSLATAGCSWSTSGPPEAAAGLVTAIPSSRRSCFDGWFASCASGRGWPSLRRGRRGQSSRRRASDWTRVPARSCGQFGRRLCRDSSPCALAMPGSWRSRQSPARCCPRWRTATR